MRLFISLVVVRQFLLALLYLGFSRVHPSILFNSISTYLLKDDVTKTYIMAAVSALVPIVFMLILKKG